MTKKNREYIENKQWSCLTQVRDYVERGSIAPVKHFNGYELHTDKYIIRMAFGKTRFIKK